MRPKATPDIYITCMQGLDLCCLVVSPRFATVDKCSGIMQTQHMHAFCAHSASPYVLHRSIASQHQTLVPDDRQPLGMLLGVT